MNTYQCKNDIINEDERKQLLSQARGCDYYNYTTDKGTNTGLQVVKLPIDGLVKKLVNKTNS